MPLRRPEVLPTQTAFQMPNSGVKMMYVLYVQAHIILSLGFFHYPLILLLFGLSVGFALWMLRIFPYYFCIPLPLLAYADQSCIMGTWNLGIFITILIF